MKSHTAVFPNPNQQILLIEAQRKICSLLNKKFSSKENFLVSPSLPVCIKSTDLKDINDRITRMKPRQFFFEDGIIFLEIGMKINGNDAKGTLELCEIHCEENESLTEIKRCDVFCETGFSGILGEIKKISPFRIVEMETEEFASGKIWRILREKWGKIT